VKIGPEEARELNLKFGFHFTSSGKGNTKICTSEEDRLRYPVFNHPWGGCGVPSGLDPVACGDFFTAIMTWGPQRGMKMGRNAPVRADSILHPNLIAIQVRFYTLKEKRQPQNLWLPMDQ
jgi:hypothetical protein